ncbi:MAG: hypothetical protein IJV27_04645, partial [Prevotella sp.]|nr:hypothetical protein [Prevotella sp.]
GDKSLNSNGLTKNKLLTFTYFKDCKSDNFVIFPPKCLRIKRKALPLQRKLSQKMREYTSWEEV